jgi:MFS family permease
LLRTGSPALLVGLTLLVTGMWSADLAVFIVGTIITGVGTGLIFRGAMSTVSESAPSGSRAEALAGFFLSAYVGLSVPVVALGLASGHASAPVLMLIFAIMVAIAATASVRSVVRRSDAGTVDRPFDTTVIGVPVSSLTRSTKFDGPRRAHVNHETVSLATPRPRAGLDARRRLHRTSPRPFASNPLSTHGPANTKEDRHDR